MMYPGELEMYDGVMANLRGQAVYDVGAYQGQFAWRAIEMGAIPYLFEPNPACWPNLEKLVPPEQLFKQGLSGSGGYRALHVPAEEGLATFGKPLRFEHYKDVMIPVTTLDWIMMTVRMPRPALIKIDTEGAELDVLAGAQVTLRKHHPLLLVEYCEVNTRQFGYEPNLIDTNLAKLGYRWEEVSPWDRLYTWEG